MNEFFLDIYNVRIILALIMLTIATTMDLWRREIHDLLWISFGAIAIVILFFEPEFSDTLFGVAVSLIIAPLALVLWRIGLFGGADAFCLIVLAALAPFATFSDGTITPFTTFTNAILLSTISLFVNAIRNGIALSRHKDIFEGFKETRLKKVIAIFLGYRAKNPRYGFSIERREGNHKKLDIVFHNADTAEFCTESNTWVTPGIPYMLFITGGFIIQLFYGDVIFTFFANIL